MKLRIFRKVSKFPNGKEYLIDNETGEPAEFESKKDILNLFKSESEVGIESEEALISWGINIESVDE
tara:strand:+ start:133 stop:333 length:201 start_codon:yes stop_codon:yes gene_type:complete